MTFTVVLTLTMALCSGAAILLLVRRLTAPGPVSECDPEWFASFTTATYRPMQRLLGEQDLKYLAAQPGITAKTVRELRRERRRIFKAYLRNLVRDFHRLHLAARMTLIYSPVDRPDLAQALLRSRAMFTWAVLMVEVRLALHTFGLAAVDVQGLIESVEGMRLNVNSFAPAAQTAGF